MSKTTSQLKSLAIDNSACSTWNKAKKVINTLTNTDEREKLQYLLYQKTMTSKELNIFYTFVLYLRYKQNINIKIDTQLHPLIDELVKKVKQSK